VRDPGDLVIFVPAVALFLFRILTRGWIAIYKDPLTLACVFSASLASRPVLSGPPRIAFLALGLVALFRALYVDRQRRGQS